jgi:hypothetical protein
MKAAVVVRGREEIKTASAMLGPRLVGEGRVEGDDKLAGGVDGMGGEVVGSTMETLVGGERGVEGSGSEVVKGKLGLGEQVVPSVRREGDMGSRDDGDKVVFGGTDCSSRRERAMVVGRDVLKSDGDRAKERGEVRRSLVVEEKMGERVRKGAKKGNNRLKGRHVGRESAGHHAVQVDVPMMQDDE